MLKSENQCTIPLTLVRRTLIGNRFQTTWQKMRASWSLFSKLTNSSFLTGFAKNKMFPKPNKLSILIDTTEIIGDKTFTVHVIVESIRTNSECYYDLILFSTKGDFSCPSHFQTKKLY